MNSISYVASPTLPMHQPLVLSTSRYTQLASAIAGLLSPDGSQRQSDIATSVFRARFPDGETYLRVDRPIHGEHVVIVGATRDADDLLEIVSLAWQVVRDGAHRLSFVIPYFGYSTMERSVRTGEVVRAKVNATIISSIPNPPGGKTVFLVDLHAEGIQHYFEGNTSVVHLYAKGALLSKVIGLLGDSALPLVVGSADTGRAKWVESYANELGADIAIITKRRYDGATTEILNVGGADVRNKVVLLYDDMIRSGGSIVKAAEAYRNAGAAQVFVACTHLVLTDGEEAATLRRVLACADALITTDSIRPNAEYVGSLGSPKVHCVSLAHLCAMAVKTGGRYDEPVSKTNLPKLQ